MLPSLCAALIVGVILALNVKIVWVSSRAFLKMIAALRASGNDLDPASEAKVRRAWFKKPEHVVVDTDSDTVRAIKLTHIAACREAVKPWKVAYRVWLTLLALGIIALIFT